MATAAKSVTGKPLASRLRFRTPMRGSRLSGSNRVARRSLNLLDFVDSFRAAAVGVLFSELRSR